MYGFFPCTASIMNLVCVYISMLVYRVNLVMCLVILSRLVLSCLPFCPVPLLLDYILNRLIYSGFAMVGFLKDKLDLQDEK